MSKGTRYVLFLNNWKWLKQTFMIAIDYMNYIHPVYHLKRLVIQRESMSYPILQNED
jgi:hypothetical protein